jgi:hypothetical protein
MTVQVLVVDDEHDVADLFRQQFRRELRSGKFLMDFAYSCAEALEHIAIPSDVQVRAVWGFSNNASEPSQSLNRISIQKRFGFARIA